MSLRTLARIEQRLLDAVAAGTDDVVHLRSAMWAAYHRFVDAAPAPAPADMAMIRGLGHLVLVFCAAMRVAPADVRVDGNLLCAVVVRLLVTGHRTYGMDREFIRDALGYLGERGDYALEAGSVVQVVVNTNFCTEAVCGLHVVAEDHCVDFEGAVRWCTEHMPVDERHVRAAMGMRATGSRTKPAMM